MDTAERTDREHALVFAALERALERVPFPASKRALVELAAKERVAADPDVFLGPYLDALPEGTYAAPEVVVRSLESRFGSWRRG